MNNSNTFSKSQCVLIKHGLAMLGKRVGVCCYNKTDPGNYHTYDIDPVNCHACIDQENNNVFSYRQGVNLKYGLDNLKPGIVVLDISPNFNCNLACKICNEDLSSTWTKYKKIPITKNRNISVDNFLKQLESHNLDQIKEINFSGGEPWLNKNIIKYIGQLENKMDFSQVTLRFCTNGTQPFTPDIIEFLLRFKLVLARFSLDDIESGHEYQRYPSKWVPWLNNWCYFLENLPHNTIPAINRTVSLLNINRLNFLDQWHQNFLVSKFNDPIELIDHFALGDFSLNNLTPEIKELVLKTQGQDSRAGTYIKNKPAGRQNLSQIQQKIIENDQYHNTNLAEFDAQLHKAIFQS